jgi:hypothetical protein
MQVCLPEGCTPGTSTRIPNHNRHQSGNEKIFFNLLEELWGLRLFRQPVVFVRRQCFVFIQVTYIEKGLQ